MPVQTPDVDTPAISSVVAAPAPLVAIEVVGNPTASTREILAAIVELTKPRITRLVTITASVGFVLAALTRTWELPHLVLAAVGCILGTALSSSGANALNMWWERRRDGLMRRTAHRPLPERRITAGAAFVAGVALSSAGVLILLVLTGPAAALVSLCTILWYVLFYTPLKPVTPLNTLVGAVPGALPPLIGWAATAPAFGFDNYAGLTSLLEAGGWCLVLLMIVWQIPHFLAIAWMYKDDYAAGGYRMMPIIDPDGRATATTVLVWSIAQLGATLAPGFILHEQLSWVYTSIAGITGVIFISLCARLLRARTRDNARAVFLASIMHLPLLLMAMVGDALVGRFLL